MQRFRPHLLEHGVTEQQWRVLRALRDEGARTNLELTRRCMLNPASQSRILHNLEGMGLIDRTTDRADRRRRAISLTAAGRALADAIAPGNDEIFNGIVAEAGLDVIETACEALDRLILKLEEINCGLPDVEAEE